MGNLFRATIVDVDAGHYRATVRLERDGQLLSGVRVNAGTAAEGLEPGHACLVAVLDEDALLVTTRLDN
jgi:hypothetical protein